MAYSVTSRRIFVLALALSAISAPAVMVPATAAAAKDPMLPDRLLSCTLRRITNPDFTKQQTEAEIIYEGSHRFDLFLPGIPVRQGPPPDAIEAPEPVDPRTRVVADPDGLTAKFPKNFTRVVDFWPDRVEMATTIDDPLVNLIIVSPIDAAAGTANLFMTQATDVATFDRDHIYRGGCKVTFPKA